MQDVIALHVYCLCLQVAPCTEQSRASGLPIHTKLVPLVSHAGFDIIAQNYFFCGYMHLRGRVGMKASSFERQVEHRHPPVEHSATLLNLLSVACAKH